MLGGSSADAARLMAATSSLMMCVESRQRFILHPRPPPDGYGTLVRTFKEAAPELETSGVFPVRSGVSVSPWVRDSSYGAFDSYMERALEQDPLAAYRGLEERSRAAVPNGDSYSFAHTISWSAFAIPARNALRRSLSERIQRQYGDRIFIPLRMTVPCLACCIVGRDEGGVRQIRALMKLFVSGRLPIGRFRVGDSWAFLTSV